MKHSFFDVGGFGMGPSICRECGTLFTGGGRWNSPGNSNEECPGERPTPRFDEVVTWQVDGLPRDVVIHRDPARRTFAWHSPLTNGAIRCSICEGGARVYVAEQTKTDDP